MYRVRHSKSTGLVVRVREGHNDDRLLRFNNLDNIFKIHLDNKIDKKLKINGIL